MPQNVSTKSQPSNAINWWIVLAGILAIMLGFFMSDNEQVTALFIDQLCIMFGSVLLGAGLSGLQIIDSLRRAQVAQIEAVESTMLDHVAAGHLDRPIPDNSPLREKVFLYHQTCSDNDGNGTLWKVVPYNFSNVQTKRRLRAESPDIFVPGIRQPIKYDAELLLKQRKIVIFVTNRDPGDAEPVGIFSFDDRVGDIYAGVIIHTDMANRHRISKAILSLQRLDGHTGADLAKDNDLDQEKINAIWDHKIRDLGYTDHLGLT